jgi:ABC-2 type transport system ATP-binding protein
MITIKDLHYQYGPKVKVFDSLNLNIEKGHIVGILGKNGVGKSTLLKCICGLLHPQKGKIYIGTVKAGERKPSILSNLFLLPEELYVPDIKPMEYAGIYGRFYPKFKFESFIAYSNEFEIPIQYRMGEMSYGQKKKTMIAFGLACHTDVIIMDEPTNGLDITSKSQFRKLVSQAITDENSILISTHQIKDVENLVDRVLILNEGNVLLDESMDTISRKLHFGFTHELINDMPFLFSEESLRGYNYITAGDGTSESKVDIELLYKAVMHHPVQLSQIIKN